MVLYCRASTTLEHEYGCRFQAATAIEKYRKSKKMTIVGKTMVIPVWIVTHTNHFFATIMVRAHSLNLIVERTELSCTALGLNQLSCTSLGLNYPTLRLDESIILHFTFEICEIFVA
jgi:hypothetical protein